MADIDQIIAGGAGSTSRGDFSGIADLPEQYWKGVDRRNVQDTRDLFKGGVPQNPDGSVNYGAMRDALFKIGNVDKGIAVDNLDLARQKLKYGQQLNEQVWPSGGQPQDSAPILPPSANRSASAPVAPALNRGGIDQPAQGAPGAASPQQPGAPAGGQPTVMKILAAQGIPNDQLGAASASLARQLGIDDPTQPIDINDPRVRNVVGGFVRQIKTAGVGNIIPPGQPSPDQQIQPPPQVMGPGGAAQPNAQGVYPSNAVMMPQGAPPVVAQGGAPPQPSPPPGPPQPAPQPPPQAQPQAGIPASQAPTDPTLGGLVPKGRTPEQQLTLLRRAVGTGLLDPNVEKVYLEQIKSLETRLAPTDQEKAFDAARRNPGLDPYISRTEAQKAADKSVAEGDVKEQNSFITAGHDASRRLTTLNTVSNIIQNDKNMTLGFGAETALKVKKALQQVGFDVGDLSGPQAIEKLNGMLASESAKTISPRPSQFEFKTFLSNNPGLNVDRAGNIRVLGIFSQLAKRDLDLGKLARQNRGDWQNWDNVIDAYDKKNPIVDPTTRTPISTNTVIAPGTEKSAAPAALPPPKPKDIINGHIFKGGNPKDPKSWAPVS